MPEINICDYVRQLLRSCMVVLNTLSLAAFRFFRICVKINNKNYLNHLMKVDVFKPILQLALQESHRDSLLSAACQELFEHMRRVCLNLVKLPLFSYCHLGKYKRAHQPLHDEARRYNPAIGSYASWWTAFYGLHTPMGNQHRTSTARRGSY